MGRRYRGGRGTALRPRRRAGPRTGFSPRRRGTGTPRPAREPETKRTVFAAILLRLSLRCKRETLARSDFSVLPPLLLSSSRCPVGEHTRGDRLGRSWIPAQPWAGRASAPLRVEKDTWRGSSHVLGHAAIASSLSLFIGWEGLFWILLYIISPRVDGIHSSNVYFLRNISLL